MLNSSLLSSSVTVCPMWTRGPRASTRRLPGWMQSWESTRSVTCTEFKKVKLALSYFTVRHRQKAVFHCYLNIERCINLFFSFSDNTKMVYCNDLSFSVKILTSTGKIKNILSKKCRITVLFLIIKSEVRHTIFFYILSLEIWAFR